MCINKYNISCKHSYMLHIDPSSLAKRHNFIFLLLLNYRKHLTSIEILNVFLEKNEAV